MYGRYGGDTLNKVYLWIYVAVVLIYYVVSLFIPVEANMVSAMVTLCYLLLSIFLIVLIFF